MDKRGMIVTIVWAIVMGIGIGMGYISKQINAGEFYLCLMMWLYVTTWFVDRNGDKK